MEWVEGRTLAAELKTRPRRSVAEAVAALEPVLDALAIAHDMGIAHRDLKPSNLMVARIGTRQTIKVLDFGIAKMMGGVREPSGAFTNPGDARMFSIAYAAPEQFDPTLGGSGPWTDVYALALILIELVDGVRPYRGESFVECRAQALDLEHRPALAEDRSIDAVLRRALAVDPRNRYASAAELRDALRAAMAPPTARRRGPKTEGPPSRRARSGARWPLVGLAIGAAVAGTYLVMRVGGQPAPGVDAGTLPNAPAASTTPTEDAVRAALFRWDDAESRHDVPALLAMHADRTCFYRYSWGRDAIGRKLTGLYADDPAFRQSVDRSTVTVTRRAAGRVRVDFEKDWTSHGTTRRTASYLVFDDRLQILVEGDERTDEMVRKTGKAGECPGGDSW